MVEWEQEAAMAKRKVAKKSVGKKTTPKTARKNGMVARRADLGADVSTYFAKLSGWHAALAKRLDRIARKAAPKASAAVKWGMPVYEHHGMLCYIRARPKYVAFGFYGQAVGLSDPKGLMEGTGKGMRHIKIRPGDAVDEAYLVGLVRQAAAENGRA
jgi:hypothetical protein